jgi:CPA1 family monovalent cation:H+ antiporter
MRGIVTLAAALALPAGGADGPAFPYRDLVLFTAFSVVLGTLVVQGMTLRPLINVLKLQDDGSVEREVRLARVETLRAALSATDGLAGDEMSGLMRRRYEVMLRRAEAELAGDGHAPDGAAASDGRAFNDDAAIVRRATAAERQRLLALRADGTIGDAAFQRVEQELDLEELDLQQR